MNTQTDEDGTPIVKATEVPENKRMDSLPSRFGRDMLTFENTVYNVVSDQAKEYTGGLWKFFDLDNGGFYMAPDSREKEYTYEVASNGFSGKLSPDAAGIVACLYAYSQLSFGRDGQKFAEHYHSLRDFAAQHAEARAIFEAID